MTISNPPLPADPSLSAAPASSADAGASAPAEGFDQFMAAEVPAPGDESPAESAADAPATDQAAVLAASILWAPLPMLVETPLPAVPEMLAAAQTIPTDSTQTGEDPLQILPEQIGQGIAPAQPDVGRAWCPTFGAEMSGINPDLQETQVSSNPEAATSGLAVTAEPIAMVEAVEASITASEPPDAPAISVSVDRPALRRAPRSERAEKIADAPATLGRVLQVQPVAAAKTFVSATQEAGRREEGIVGTSVAKPGSEMSYALADHPSAAALASAHAAPDWQHLQFDLTAATEPAQRARDTVANVMSVIDAQEKPEPATNRMVSMDFDFGGERLAVRVEFRDGAVRAHFRTQSLELRSALASEWSHVSAAPENVLRAVEPVFVTSSRSEQQSASFNADGGASRQQQPAPEFKPRPASISSRSSAAAPAAAPDEALRFRRPFTTRHLHAIA